MRDSLKQGDLNAAFDEVFKLGQTYYADNRIIPFYTEVCEAFQTRRPESLSLTPGASCRGTPSTTLFFERGVQLLKTGHYQEADKYFGRTTLSNPSIEESSFFMGEAARYRGSDFAKRAFTSFSEYHPTHPLTRIARARLDGDETPLPGFPSINAFKTEASTNSRSSAK